MPLNDNVVEIEELNIIFLLNFVVDDSSNYFYIRQYFLLKIQDQHK